MNNQQLLDEILGVLRLVKEDKAKLEQIHTYMLEEIYEEEKTLIPKKYKKIINSIAQSIDCGFICYFNVKTNEIIEIPKEIDDVEELYENDLEKIDKLKEKIVFEPLESFDSFKIMERFADNVSDQVFQDKLYNALNRKRPFANFKNTIDYSDYRQDWFDFKQAALEEVVSDQFESVGLYSSCSEEI